MNTAVLSQSETVVKYLSATDMRQLNTEELLTELAETGVLLFRQGAETVDEFCDFVKRHSSRLSLDPARTMEGGAAQLVDAGTDAVGLHCENGNSPFWPDLTWFYCKEAPRMGSQTTACDGAAVLERLSERTRDFFLRNEIRYSRNVQADKWKRLVAHYTPGLDNLDQVSFEHLQRVIGDDPNTQITYNPADESIGYDFTVSAVLVSAISRQPAFANSILGPSYNYEKPRITVAASGEPIPAAMMEEVVRITDAATIPINWDDNDFVMIDNRRVMHGRRAIIDTRRKIFNALSYL
ncbi:taurine catabolism dioxygenase TauD [Chromobacterium phragmitis]|uniref:TauD/TfdA family dioxygenase n=1 Tax=Chromobacterium phragmitis TaxID=2202141 RepID=A0A344UG83_9NEIS|nr:TauD/TfdA family dioxygenase [Chromobacterium phragmitis]AXE28921.1 taurine catabolism dioxygenase TauD [Chromobacterium phragmitis]AXE34281.1 taurine catabolism dioxygenase TauD [Chromobacterium phragmitis]